MFGTSKQVRVHSDRVDDVQPLADQQRRGGVAKIVPADAAPPAPLPVLALDVFAEARRPAP